MSEAQQRLEEAQSRYHKAASEFSGAILQWVAATVTGRYPTAAKLVAYGDYDEDGARRLRLRQVFDDAGRTLGDVEEPTEAFDELADVVDPYLDWLAELNGDDYLGDQEIALGGTQ